MHLHHELQRALAATKVDAGSPPVLTPPDEQTGAPKTGRRALHLLPHRPARRAMRTLGARHQ
jgi:hypothetical protein